MKYEETAADRAGMTLEELEGWITTMRTQGAGGKEVPRVRVTLGGRVKSISAEVESGASPLYAKRP